MFIHNKQIGKLYNLDKVVDVFPGKNAGDVSIALENGVISVFAKYDSEVEAVEMIAMLAEFMAVSGRDVFTAPDSEEVKTRLRNRPEIKPRYITGKKMKGHGGS